MAYVHSLHHITPCPRTLLPVSPLRLSYLSYDFRDHPMGHLTQGLITSHHPDRFMVQAASYGPPDNSTYRRRIAEGAHLFSDLKDLGEMEASCSAISSAFHPHILIDLMALTRGTRPGLPALRPAPLVLNYLGYPATSGAGFSDYIGVDRVVAPVELARSTFSEKLLLLPHCYQANDYSPSLPLASSPLLHSPPSSPSSPPQPLVLCNLNHVDKLDPPSFSLWMAMLRRLPHASLHLLRPSAPIAESVITALHLEAASYGVHPSRLVFLPRVSKDEHVSRLSQCHVFVDTLTYGAHSTASDALFAGLPLLTLQGYGGRGGLGPFPSRVGASLLQNLGRGEMVALSVKDMEDLAVRWGAEGREGREIREGLQLGLAQSLMHSPVFSVPITTRALERGTSAPMSSLAPAHP